MAMILAAVSGSVVEAGDGRPRSLMTSCGCPPARCVAVGDVHGGDGGANDCYVLLWL
ncbi:hypothetical protein PF003_g36021 [Phytophthora fragariae]|nr:hypothetical protein PF003_g36020 [Phytophthora fragariae]KAE8879892.1 hypothetical protein PF003_g36021 [Phytophthora fragariae]